MAEFWVLQFTPRGFWEEGDKESENVPGVGEDNHCLDLKKEKKKKKMDGIESDSHYLPC